MSLEYCFDRAEYLLQEAEQIPLEKSKRAVSSLKWKSLRRKVHETFSEALKTPQNENYRATSGLLPSLAKKFGQSRLVVSLFPLNDGYSITLMKNDGSCAESLNMPYDESEILDFIDNEELPPVLVETLHRYHSSAFQCGSVLAEVRDYRIAADESSFETHFVILKPTQQTLNGDVNIIAEETSNSYKWGVDDKLALESYLTLATSDPLCLDTSPTVTIIKNKLQARTKAFNTRLFRKMIRRNGAQAHRRRQVMEKRPAPAELKLHDFLQEHKKLKKDYSSAISPDVKLPLHVVDVWRKSPLELPPPEEIYTDAQMKPFSSPNEKSEEIIEVQSILLESEGVDRDVCSRITIGQRPRDMHYFGMLQSNKYFKQNVMENRESHSIFSLGTEHRANLYILQYQELFTEDGRRPAKVTVIHANQAPVVYHIPNQQQPWQLAQERSAYSVGSVINIPVKHWRKMNSRKIEQELNSTSIQTQETIPTTVNQIQKPRPQKGNAVQMASTPTLNSITLQNSAQSAFTFPGSAASSVAAGRRFSKIKSSNSIDNSTGQIQPGRRSRQGSEVGGLLQTRTAVMNTQSSSRDGAVNYSVKNQISEGNTQSYTLNPSVLANALTQMGGGAVSLQVPVMTVNSQQATSSTSQVGHPTTTVLRMPVGISGSSGNSAQITAALNLIGGGQNILTSNVIGNIQLATGTTGITIPANQLPANLAMQLTSVANSSSQQQISLVTAAPSNMASQQISIVGQSGTTTPFTIVTNNDNWQIQEAIKPSNQQQQTYSLTPRTHIVAGNGRQVNPQQQQVQVVQQLRIPSHLLNSIVTSSEQVTVEQLVAAAAKHNRKRRPTQD